MFVLGHTGLTLGAAVLLSRAFSKGSSRQPEDNTELSSEASTVKGNSASGMRAWFVSLGNLIDIRVLFIGSLLPDIIDKPLGYFFLRETYSSVRIYCHTLLFFILITLAGLVLYRYRRQTWLLVLSFGTFTHLLCDQMWLTPQTLFWPLYGTGFVEKDLSHWTAQMLNILVTDPPTYIPEILGGIILVLFLYVVARNRKLITFIRHGKLAKTELGR